MEEDDLFSLPNIKKETWVAKEDGLIYWVETINDNVTGTVACEPYSKLQLYEATIQSYVNLNGETILITKIIPCGFEGCENLKRIVIPDSITNIGFACFKDCISLEEVFIPDSVTHIGFGVFAGCKNLKKVSLPAHLEVKDNVFSVSDARLVEIKRRLEQT